MIHEEELIGCIIDTFEDDLHNRNILNINNDNTVYYEGNTYDCIADKLRILLKEFRITL